MADDMLRVEKNKPNRVVPLFRCSGVPAYTGLPTRSLSVIRKLSLYARETVIFLNDPAVALFDFIGHKRAIAAKDAAIVALCRKRRARKSARAQITVVAKTTAGHRADRGRY
ncbi:MAG: hypothetical protein LBP73_11600 [Clostridiales Family XIII bacterium]|nr:hypothetical protein [Clostridiales Family XIII bacterium]